MAISLVQSQGELGALQNNPSTQVQTFTEPIAQGSFLVCVAVYFGDTGTLNVPTDTAGNTNWRTAATLQVFQLYTSAIFYCFDSLASAAGNEVSCAITGASFTMGSMHISQWAGIVSASDPLDGHNTASASSSSIPTVGITTTQKGNLVLGWSSVAGPGGGAGGSGPGTGFFTLYDDKFIDLLQFQPGGASGSITITAPPAEGAWQILGAAFKALQPNPVLDGSNT